MPESNLASSKYWQERAERRVLAAERSAEEMLGQVQKMFEDASRQITKEIEAFYGRFASREGITLEEAQMRLTPQELSLAKLDIERYYSEVSKYLDGNIIDEQYRRYLRTLSGRAYMSRMDLLNVDLRRITSELYSHYLDSMGNSLDAVFEDSFYRSIFDFQHATGYASEFYGLNQPAIQKAIDTRWLGANYSKRIWEDQVRLESVLTTTIQRGIVLGYNPRKIGVQIAKEMGTRNNVAIRLARTEHNHIMNQATLGGYSEMGIKQYQFVATLDNRTSVICQELDGKIFDVGDEAEGINYPPMHPNCRSTTKAYFESNELATVLANARRMARDEFGDVYYIPGNVTYAQWRAGLMQMPDGKMRYNIHYEKAG